MATKAVFFDIDGTLVDSNRWHIETWHRVFAATGRPVDRERIAEQIGKGADNLVPTLFPEMSDDQAEELGTLHGRFFKADYLDRVRPFPHARDLLQRVHDSGRRVVFASSASGEELDHYIDLLDARSLVDLSTTKDDVETTKPAPDIFATARDKADVDPAEVVVIGDAPYDMQAAAKCGMHRVGVRSGGFDDAVLTEAGAQLLYDDVAAILRDFDASPLSR
ncbi:membrane protein [Sphingomonas gellani]|uniref:Membrane protein n=1 Tax=Sphingomonas gellani TaxID=1166340 RepID=A0A1H8AHY1_9SPHN|nr:HAD family hydrolase [Sphingomonas gellani]SEM70143.1 membrane protein [Sphingomonas gellani]